jgi:methionyl-tRNA synthetase
MARFYLTTPIYYVNDRPHIGHVYTTTVTDILARWGRLNGDDVYFLTGVDEHAAKVADAAAERGLTPQQWANQNAAEFRDTFTRFGITNDDFVRTTEARHKERVQRYLAALLKTGDVYVGEYSGWYDAGQEEYVPETKAEEYAFKSPVNGKPLVRKTENNYFFRLSAYREPLLALLDRGETIDGRGFTVEPVARRKEILARIPEMEDVPISRTGQSGWGIPFPGDGNQTVYVWIDALFNYLTYVDDDRLRPYWESGATQLIAKDILWFHAAIWPALLLALRKCPGYEWVNLPARLYAHSFWISDGRKMSKSLGNFVDLEKLDRYVATFGLDALRWFLATQGPIGAFDSDFSETRFIETYNVDLANNLGNLVNRVTSMAHRYRAGVLRAPASTSMDYRDDYPNLDEVLQTYSNHMREVDLGGAAATALWFVDRGNESIARREPWKLAKTGDDAGVDAVLWNASEALRLASVLMSPFMPKAAAEILRRLGVDPDLGNLRWARDTEWQAAGERSLQQGELLWPRAEPAAKVEISTKEKTVTEEVKAPTTVPAAPDAAAAAPPASQWPMEQRITIDEFMKIDLRVARILTAERVPNSKKLMKLEIDLGSEKRTLVAGIAEAYEADALVGRLVAIVANLKPAKLMGIESNGMVLAASPEGGRPMLVSFDEPPPPGSRVR